MCGIAGYFGERLPPAEHIRAATLALAHRGPDGAGVYVRERGAESVALIHRRLAIIDLHERSGQPFHYDDSVLAFNGEIYNYVELRSELESCGHSFSTDGDTEVLVRALRHWGNAALNRLEGMWAFAWYDQRAGTLLLSRDRFGEKPLYLWRRDGGVYFSSEVKGLAALAGRHPGINRQHLIRYMVNGYKSLYKVSDTFFEDVEELPRSNSLELGTGSRTPEPYWTPKPSEDLSLSYDDAVAATRDAVIETVRLRMRADVPLAFCMSGGVDSNTLIATAKKVLGCDVHGFTIMNTDARYEEEDLVQAAVQELGIRHTPVPLRQSGFLDDLRGLIRAHDSPVYTISYYVHWQLMQAVAAEGYKVTISGTGADELFTGYYDHHNLYLYEMAGYPEGHAHALAMWREYQAPIVRNPYLKDPNLFLKDPTFRGHIYLNKDLFGSWLHEPWAEDFTETDYDGGLLRKRMQNELFAEAVPVIVHEDDLNAMFFSMENRSPFLDRSLFDLAYSIPRQHLVQDGRTKAVLRDAMRGIVPDPILDSRRKVGFNAPILDLMDTHAPEVRAAMLDDSPIFDIVQKERIEELLDRDHLANSESKFLFYFINAKIFMEDQGRP